jgi:hypothetical protein
MTWPTIYRYEGRWWHGGLDRHGLRDDAWLIADLWWLMRHGEWCTGWNWPKLVFGFGRSWYDGSIWHLNLGIWSVSLSH